MQAKTVSCETHKPTIEEIARAWEYHRDGDGILHSRIQSFIMAEAFLVAAFAQLVPALDQTGNKITAIVAICISAIGFGATLLMASKTHSVLKKVSYLKDAYLMHDNVYKNYMNSGSKSWFSGWRAINVYTITIPLGLAVFWLVMVILCFSVVLGIRL